MIDTVRTTARGLRSPRVSLLPLAALLAMTSAGAASPAATNPATVADTPAVSVHGATTTLPAGLRQIPPSGKMVLRARQGNLLKLPRAASKVLVANPLIASHQVPAPDSLFVFGERVGVTTLYALDAKDQVISAVELVVEHDLDTLAAELRRSVPGARVELEPSTNNRILVRGQVRSPLEAKQISDQIQAYVVASGAVGDGGQPGQNTSVINQLKVEQSSQVNIQVRVVEVSRSLGHELGFNWNSALSTGRGRLVAGTGNNTAVFDAATRNVLPNLLPPAVTAGGVIGGMATRGRFSLGGLISAMSNQGMATLLAEPNLTAMSGESAAFAAGGEVPIVIITNNNVNIEYKSYGVILRMTPTLLSANRISLHIAPEVSELTTEGQVTIPGGTTIPAFNVRRADTTVELASGQSFALAGMLRSSKAHQIGGVPGLSSIPWLGRIFDNETTEARETELVILVTANVVDPVAAGSVQVPGQGLPPVEVAIPSQATAGYLY